MRFAGSTSAAVLDVMDDRRDCSGQDRGFTSNLVTPKALRGRFSPPHQDLGLASSLVTLIQWFPYADPRVARLSSLVTGASLWPLVAHIPAVSHAMFASGRHAARRESNPRSPASAASALGSLSSSPTGTSPPNSIAATGHADHAQKAQGNTGIDVVF